MTNSKSIANKTLWSSLASVCGMSGRLIAQVIIARMLGPDGVGRVAYVVWLVEITNLFCSFGLPRSLTRYLAELNGQGQHEQARFFSNWVFIRYLTLILFGSAFLAALLIFSSDNITSYLVIITLIILFCVHSLRSIYTADLVGRQRFNLLACINIIATVLLVAGVTIGGYIWGVMGVLIGYIIGAILPAALSFTMVRCRSPKIFFAQTFRLRVWKFTFFAWLATLSSAFTWSRMEIYFIERYWGMHEVAMFTVGLTFTVMAQRAATIFCGALMAHFSGLVGNDNKTLIQRHFTTATKLTAFIVVPVAFVGSAIMPALLPTFFGPEFKAAVPNAMVLMVTAALAFSTIGSSLIYAKERSNFIALGGGVGAFFSIAGGFLIISQFGAWGAAWSRLFVQVAMIALGTWYIVNRLSFSFPFKSLGKIIVAAVISSISAWWIIEFLHNPYVALIIAVPSGIIIYLVSIRLFRIFKMEEIAQFKKLTARLPWRVEKLMNSMLDAMVIAK